MSHLVAIDRPKHRSLGLRLSEVLIATIALTILVALIWLLEGPV